MQAVLSVKYGDRLKRDRKQDEEIKKSPQKG